MRISDWSSDVCSSDLTLRHVALAALDVIADGPLARTHPSGGIAGQLAGGVVQVRYGRGDVLRCSNADAASSVGWGNICGVEGAADFPLCLRSEEHTSELQSLMRISDAGFCLKKKHANNTHLSNNTY